VIPVTVIGGYLGAGKTTLVNHLLRDPRGERLAVIVNDFGSVNIDAELIESIDGETVQLTNGCVCCSLASGLAEVLFELRDGGRTIDRVVVEASGVADPVATAQYAHLPGFALDAVIVLADATSVRRMANDRYVSRQVTRQLADADLVVLNKVDLIDDERETTLREWLQRTAPSVPVVAAVRAAVDREVLLGDLRPHRAASLADTDPPHHDAMVSHDATANHESWSFTTTGRVPADALAAVVESLPEHIVRVKGIVADVDETGRVRVVQRVGRRTTWADAPLSVVDPGSRLVVIGLPCSGGDPAVVAALTALDDLFASHDQEVHP
jgi:G3E family GTPase